jgi:hypothetical protein
MITHKDAIETMKRFTKSEKGFVGIFWYDSENNELAGIIKTPVETAFDNRRGSKTTDVLHKDLWRNIRRLFPEKETFMDLERGRIFYDYRDDKFIVKIGDWIKQMPQAKEIIIQEFELPKNTEFDIDEHWNIGRGESDLYI